MSIPFEISAIEKLTVRHDTSRFKCGRNQLDLFIRKYALLNQLADSSQTYVVHQIDTVLGYHTLVFSSVRLEESPESIQATMPGGYNLVPVMLFARFAVDKKVQGHGIGASLLKDALLRTNAAADIGGLAAILVDAIDTKMAAYYRNLGFQPCPGSELRLMMPIKDLRAHLSSGVAPH